MKHSLIVLAFLSSIILFGCSSMSTNQFLVKRAPEIIIPSAKIVKLKNFELDSNIYHSNLTDTHKADLQLALVNRNTFGVVLNGDADVILSGTLNFITEENETLVTESTDSEGNLINICQAFRVGKLQVQVIVTNGEGEVKGTSQFDIVEDSSASGSCGSKIHKNLLSKDDMLAKALKSSISGIVRSITPYTETANRVLAVAVNRKIETANELAENGHWEQAYKNWTTAQLGSVGTKVASLYNQSIYFEKKGDLDKASALMKKAINFKPEKRFTSRLQLLSKLMTEKKSLNIYYAN